ncbi:CemA family protein [Nostoc sp. FACHB-152]|uniref:CemA family protein n=1 Tax=unclassified Nostoc TaxID=2593658 RepID=UPI0016887C04|nr:MULTISPECIES: CemA family protein [unclassified Nostoc]MBD2451954.1 CemA family protein [Nostoc sp. FACHB-152]MBD2473046.1 CemA family protein [Nostoc sp. FACHB-145]
MKVLFTAKNKLNSLVNGLATSGLEDAYQAANAIKTMEIKHFGGDRIVLSANNGKTVADYFQTQLERQLLAVQFGLAQFKFSIFLVTPDVEIKTINAKQKEPSNYQQESESLTTVAKLKFIESVVSKYRTHSQTEPQAIEAEFVAETPKSEPPEPINEVAPTNQLSPANLNRLDRIPKAQRGSFLQNFANLGKEMSPEYEMEMVKELRKLRQQEQTAIRWILLLVIIPLVLQITCKTFIFTPLLNQFFDANLQHIVINSELKQEALAEYSRAKEMLEIDQLLGLSPELSPQKVKETLQEIASELYHETGYKQQQGLANLLADVVALLTFVSLGYMNRDKLLLIKGLINRTFQGFSDTIKAFILILVTDMFVGFHSPEGWEVVLGGIAHHFGLPENHNAIFLFIATVPVIMDSYFKLWIFNYLTRSSPSSVAILEKMNQ